MFLGSRRSVVPSFSAALRLEVEEKGEEKRLFRSTRRRRLRLLYLTRNRHTRTRAKQQEKVGLLSRMSRMSSFCTWLYNLGSLTMTCTSKGKRFSLFKLLERFSKPNIRFGSGRAGSKIVSKFRLTHNRKLRSANRNTIDHTIAILANFWKVEVGTLKI